MYVCHLRMYVRTYVRMYLAVNFEIHKTHGCNLQFDTIHIFVLITEPRASKYLLKLSLFIPELSLVLLFHLLHLFLLSVEGFLYFLKLISISS